MAILNIKNLRDSLYRKLQKRARYHHRSVAQEVTSILAAAVASPKRLSIVELRGLGKEAWQAVDAKDHVDRERRAWD